MRTLKAAVIGSGLIAGLKHVPAFKKHRSRVELAALCDLNLEAARKLAAE
ncbi:MAG: Gfo/Idh/MocA family oxidoreductase, partial [Acidobacteriia bacterium]|nr:Gfo/Idh/MocA family oxidoreductase [Terriglobia bacterium]